MDIEAISAMQYALRDPAGLPFFPHLFLLLNVVVFALHIFAVQLMLGASGISIYGAYSNDANWRRLSLAMLDVAKIAVSVAIVVGVAPLLFVQVVYDPHWYVSNVLSANWVIGFIVLLIVGYWFMYMFYFKNYNKDYSRPPKSRWSMVVSIAILLVVGFIMHMLTYQMLAPDQWQQWYMTNGQVDTTGSGIHDYNLWRFFFFISMSVPVVGGWIVAYRRFFTPRADIDQTYLDWAGSLGVKLMQIGSGIALVFFIGWMMTLPEHTASFAWSIWAIAAAVAIIGYGAMAVLVKGKMHQWGYLTPVVAVVVGLVIALMREIYRFNVLNGVFQYNPFDYPVNMDWYSTILFLGTFGVLGGVVLAYLLTVAWKAGQTEGVYTPGPVVRRLGTLSIALIALWIVQYFAIGFYIWAL